MVPPATPTGSNQERAELVAIEPECAGLMITPRSIHGILDHADELAKP